MDRVVRRTGRSGRRGGRWRPTTRRGHAGHRRDGRGGLRGRCLVLRLGDRDRLRGRGRPARRRCRWRAASPGSSRRRGTRPRRWRATAWSTSPWIGMTHVTSPGSRSTAAAGRSGCPRAVTSPGTRPSPRAVWPGSSGTSRPCPSPTRASCSSTRSTTRAPSPVGAGSRSASRASRRTGRASRTYATRADGGTCGSPRPTVPTRRRCSRMRTITRRRPGRRGNVRSRGRPTDRRSRSPATRRGLPGSSWRTRHPGPGSAQPARSPRVAPLARLGAARDRRRPFRRAHAADDHDRGSRRQGAT